jgi:hypothetical protein
VHDTLILTEAELEALTGYSQPARQLRALHALGYFRARTSPRTGRIILERAHYYAIAEGRVTVTTAAPARPRPKLRLATA